jgi:peptide/nickel transport system permease protein
MTRYIARRLLNGLMVAFIVSILTFFLTYSAGDPAVAMAGEGTRAEDAAALRAQHGLDRPLPVQYLQWVGRVVTGDFGKSYRTHTPVLTVVLERLPVTLTLATASILVALAIAIPLGVLGAMAPGGWIDRAVVGLSAVAQSIPAFWLALVLMIFFGVRLRWLPISGNESWRHFILPTATLAFYSMPGILGLIRVGMINVLKSDYIRTARAKGLSRGSVLFKHALRNAAVPVVSLTAVQFGFLLGGSVIIETIFALNGVGYLSWQSILGADLPVIQAVVLLSALFFVFLTLLADILNAWINPRMRIE